MRVPVVCVILVLFAANQLFAQLPTQVPKHVPESVSFEKDVVYGKGGDEELKLDLSLPRNSNQLAPCIVVIHGGAWRGGNKAGHDNLTWMFAERGYVSATIGYRFCPKHTFPAQIEDAKCAVRFLRANAEKYRLDPQRIGAIGFSAGAHLSLMLGVMGKEDGLEGNGGWQDQPSQVSAVVSYFGPTDFLADDIPEVSKPLLRDFVGGTPQDKPEENKKASPINYVSKGDASILFFQGTKDPLVPHTQAYRMIETLTKAGVHARAEILVGAAHGWGGSDLQRTITHTLDFFEEQLKPSSTTKTR